MTVLNKHILERFRHLLREARNCDPSTFSLASVDERGLPTLRTIMLVHIDAQGLVFFTNSRSRKGQHFAQNPYASACFYWHNLHQQVEFDGRIKMVGTQQTDDYWNSRERESQISAWASQQSDRLESRAQLLQEVKDVKKHFRDILVPRPPHWLAYRLIPERVEFWKSGWHRLHERTCFESSGESWQQNLLYP